MITLASAIENSLGTDDETVIAWASEARRLESRLDEAVELGDALYRLIDNKDSGAGAAWRQFMLDTAAGTQ